MNINILKYFEMKLLWKNKRIMDESGKIKDIYIQPERLNPEDARNSVCDSLTSTNK